MVRITVNAGEPQYYFATCSAVELTEYLLDSYGKYRSDIIPVNCIENESEYTVNIATSKIVTYVDWY